MNHEQLLSRNHVEFSDMVYTFHEINSVYENQFTLYLDSNGWELFDIRVGKCILKNDFKHFRQFIQDMKKLQNDICNVMLSGQKLNRHQRPSKSEVWSIKALLQHYSLYDKYLFNEKLVSYVRFGSIKEKENFKHRLERH